MERVRPPLRVDRRVPASCPVVLKGVEPGERVRERCGRGVNDLEHSAPMRLASLFFIRVVTILFFFSSRSSTLLCFLFFFSPSIPLRSDAPAKSFDPALLFFILLESVEVALGARIFFVTMMGEQQEKNDRSPKRKKCSNVATDVANPHAFSAPSQGLELERSTAPFYRKRGSEEREGKRAGFKRIACEAMESKESFFFFGCGHGKLSIFCFATFDPLANSRSLFSILSPFSPKKKHGRRRSRPQGRRRGGRSRGDPAGRRRPRPQGRGSRAGTATKVRIWRERRVSDDGVVGSRSIDGLSEAPFDSPRKQNAARSLPG